MGEYYNWVNVDKKEYICPADFDYGNKARESMGKDGAVLRALRSLLRDEWKGSRVIWVGDEYSIYDELPLELSQLLQKHSASSDYEKCVFDIVYSSYRNVSCLFKETEEVCRKEIEYYLQDLEQGEDKFNEYGINQEKPFEGLFMRAGIDAKYIINYTKNVCYSFEATKVLFLDNTECDFADPLPILMGCGRVLKPGDWLGDSIGAVDEIDDTVQILDKIYLDW